MKKDFFIYITFLFFILIAAVVIWPTRWINVDVGSFSYHKLWEGPQLSDLTFGIFDYDFDFPLGKDIKGGSKVKLQAVFPEGVEQKEKEVAQLVDLVRKRLGSMGYKERVVYSQKEGEEYFIYTETSALINEFVLIDSLLFSKGQFLLSAEESSGTEEELLEVNVEAPESLQIVGNGIKGFRIIEEDRSVYLEIGLNELQGEQISNSIAMLFGKALTGNLDGMPLYIDNSHLSEQIQMKGQVNTLRLFIFGDETMAKAYGSVVKHGPLPFDLEIVDRTSFEGSLGANFSTRGMYLIVLFLVLSSVLFTFLFKLDGLVGSISAMLYTVSVVAVSKAFHTTLTFGSFVAFLYGVGTFVGLVAYILFQTHKKSKSQPLRMISYLEGKRFNEFFPLFIITQLGLCAIVLVVAPWPLKFIASQLLICLALQWLWLDLIMTYLYSIFNIVKQ